MIDCKERTMYDDGGIKPEQSKECINILVFTLFHFKHLLKIWHVKDLSNMRKSEIDFYFEKAR